MLYESLQIWYRACDTWKQVHLHPSNRTALSLDSHTNTPTYWLFQCSVLMNRQAHARQCCFRQTTLVDGIHHKMNKSNKKAKHKSRTSKVFYNEMYVINYFHQRTRKQHSPSHSFDYKNCTRISLYVNHFTLTNSDLAHVRLHNTQLHALLS